MAFSDTAFGPLDGVNDVVLVPAPPPTVRRLVTSLRIINNDSASSTTSIRLRRAGIVPSGDPLFVSVFPPLVVAAGQDVDRGKQVMLTSEYDLVASLAVEPTTDPVTFVAIWMDLA